MTSHIRKTLNASVAALTAGLAASTLAPTSASAFALGGLGHAGSFGHVGGFGHMSGIARVDGLHTGNLVHLSGDRGLAVAGHGVPAGRMGEAHPIRTRAADTTPKAKSGTIASEKAGAEKTTNTMTDKSVADQAASKPAYGDIGLSSDDGLVGVNRAFVQWAGMTAGITESFYDFYSAPAVAYNGSNVPTGDPGWFLSGYTAQLATGTQAAASSDVVIVTGDSSPPIDLEAF